MNVGVDIEEVDRFQKLLSNTRFLNRVFTKREISYCRSKKNQAQRFAVRFAAKEALWKALSDLIDRHRLRIGHKDLGIKNNDKGKPIAVLPRALSHLSKKLVVSLSHTRAYAVAVAVLND